MNVRPCFEDRNCFVGVASFDNFKSSIFDHSGCVLSHQKLVFDDEHDRPHGYAPPCVPKSETLIGSDLGVFSSTLRRGARDGQPLTVSSGDAATVTPGLRTTAHLSR